MYERVVREATADVARRQKEVSDKARGTYRRVLKNAGLSGEEVEVSAQGVADQAVGRIWGDSAKSETDEASFKSSVQKFDNRPARVEDFHKSVEDF